MPCRLNENADDRGLARILDDARHLVGRAVDHERRLMSLMSAIEGEASEALTSRTPQRPEERPLGSPSVAESHPPSVATLAVVRRLCVEAREQRGLAEACLANLTGLARTELMPHTTQPRVLVVDDSQDMREIVATALEAAGLHVTTANNGLEGLIAAHIVQPVVILMDVTMPVLDGIEATRLLKAGDATRHVHVIAHTAKPDFFHGAMTRLFAHVLPKPAAPDVVVASVLRFVVDHPEAPPQDRA